MVYNPGISPNIDSIPHSQSRKSSKKYNAFWSQFRIWPVFTGFEQIQYPYLPEGGTDVSYSNVYSGRMSLMPVLHPQEYLIINA